MKGESVRCTRQVLAGRQNEPAAAEIIREISYSPRRMVENAPNISLFEGP